MMDYRFKPISKNCAKTGKPLVPGSVCYSILVERNGDLERLDFSEEGWEGVPKEAVGFWKCRVPVPEVKDAARVDSETLMQLFEQLQESPNPQQERLAYVLALHLLQRRRLKLDDTAVVEESDMLQLIGSRGEGPFAIRDQKLTQTEIVELRGVLNRHLTTGGEAA